LVWRFGTVRAGSLVINDEFNFSSGTLGFTGPAGLTVGAGGTFGSALLLNTAQNLNVTNTLTVDSAAYVVVGGGLRAGNVVNNGDLVVINTAIDGPVVNTNAVTVVGSVDFNGQVSGPGGFFGPGTSNFNGGLAVGASPAEVSFEGSVALGGANTLFIELGGLARGSTHDAIVASGSLMLDGTLAVSLIDAGAGLFEPEAGDSFDLLDWGSITGAFAEIQLPSLSGSLRWNTSQLYSTGILSVVPAFEADFDEDHDVDVDDRAARPSFASGAARFDARNSQ
jgi:hypothetical protein